MNRCASCRQLSWKLSKCGSAILAEQLECLDLLSDVKDLLYAAIDDNAPINTANGGVIKDGYNANG